MEKFDKIIIGAGMYGCYAAKRCADKGEKILLLEHDGALWERASFNNQARVHMGYHYPRSLTTAMKSAGYYHRFVKDYHFAINGTFQQVYATSANFSWTNAEAFRHFCKSMGILCEEIVPTVFFKPGMCDGCFLTEEVAYDAGLIRDYYANSFQNLSNLKLQFYVRLDRIYKYSDEYVVEYHVGDKRYVTCTGFVLNATYASVNQVINLVENIESDFSKFKIKYELAELICCSVTDSLKNVGLTVMDGPFFSIMPFGNTGCHTLTAVIFTPHTVSYEDLPTFSCQSGVECSVTQLGNCNTCTNRPESAWDYMRQLARKYMRDEYEFRYEKSLYAIKPILTSSEVDDSRPTVVRLHSSNPTMISVLSGKINTVYDLDEYLI